MTRIVGRKAGRRLRFTPIVGEKVWFGPRGWGGWGWTPVSWEGWTAFALALAGMGAVILRNGEDDGTLPVLAITALLVLVCWLKGTSPGSASAKAEFEHARSQNGRLVKGWRPPDEPSVNDIVDKPWSSDPD